MTSLIFQSNRDKLIQSLLDRITSFVEIYASTSNIAIKQKIKEALDVSEKLLKFHGSKDINLSFKIYKGIEQVMKKELENILKLL